MVLVFLAGTVVRGSRRWIDLGFFQFQPSEFGKVLFVLFLAAFVADRAAASASGRRCRHDRPRGDPDHARVRPAGLRNGARLRRRPRRGAFVGGARWLHLSVLAVFAVLTALALLWLLPAAGVDVLKPYQAERLKVFTDRDRDPAGTTYNVNQSITVVGAGGLNGRGVDKATQTRFDYLPEHATDFVFACSRSSAASSARRSCSCSTCCSGAACGSSRWHPMRSRRSSPAASSSRCSRSSSTSDTTMGIAPITGIPLPFVSVGGSSMITNLLAIGVLEAIHLARPGARPVASRLMARLDLVHDRLAPARAKTAAESQGPVSVEGAPALAEVLRKELTRGGDESAARTVSPDAEALVYVLAAEPTKGDESILAAASRARVPTVVRSSPGPGSTAAFRSSSPTPDIVRVPPASASRSTTSRDRLRPAWARAAPRWRPACRPSATPSAAI